MIKDHEGHEFESITDKCKVYNISRTTYRNRIKKGMSEKEALTTPVKRKQQSINYNGVHYNKLSTFLKAYNLSMSDYYNAKNLGWSLDELVHKSKSFDCVDPYGNTFNNMQSLLKHYNISKKQYYYWLDKGKTLKEIIDLQYSKHHICDPFNNEFDSVDLMYKCYNLPKHIYQSRKDRNLPISQVLGIVPMPSKLHQINNSDYYILKTDDYGEIIIPFETLEKYYISKFDQSKLDKSYMINNNEELNKIQ